MVSPNQRILDLLVRHKVYLLGFGKHVADRVFAILDATEPEMRKHLLDIFGTSTGGSRVIARLRDAEARLFGIRSRAWNKSLSEVVSLLTEMAGGEQAVLEFAVKSSLVPPKSENWSARRVNSALLAGHKLKDWWKTIKDSDIRRMIGQLRVSVFGGETVTQILARIAGRLSPIANAAKNSVSTVIHTAVGAVVAAVRKALIEANSVLFDWELWVSILDSRTTRTCRKLDGQQFPVGEGPQPGYHPYCRSDRIPITDGGGGYTLGSYRDWAALQPLSFRRYAGAKEFSVKTLKPLSFADVREREERDEV